MPSIKSFKGFILDEDVAAVSTGAGMAGLGNDPPGRKAVLGPIQRRRVKIHPRPAKKLTENKLDGAITLSIPVLIRALEISREMLKSDDDLHVFVEKLMDLDDSGTLTMDDAKKVFSQYKD
jgi:hypothetical protein